MGIFGALSSALSSTNAGGKEWGPLLSRCRWCQPLHLAGASALWLQLLIYRIDHVFIDGLVKDPMQTDKVKLEVSLSGSG